MILTAEATLGLELSKELANRPPFSATRLCQSLTDSLPGIGLGGGVKKALIRLGILHYGGGLALHRQHDWTLALVELLHEVAGTPTKSGQGVNVLGDVKHR